MYTTLPRAYQEIYLKEYSEVQLSFRTPRILRSEIKASYDNDTKKGIRSSINILTCMK